MFCSKLPRYVRMVDQVLLSTLVRLSRSSIVDFVNLTMMPDPDASREALFKTALVFNHKTGTQCNAIIKIHTTPFLSFAEKQSLS